MKIVALEEHFATAELPARQRQKGSLNESCRNGQARENSPFGSSNSVGTAAVGKKSYLLIHVPA